MPGEHLDLSSEPDSSQPAANSARPFVGVRFACCAVYARVYRNAEATAYQGKCPRCGKPVLLRIGPTGSSERFFNAY